MKYGVEAAAVLPLILAASFRARWQLRTGQLQGRNDASVEERLGRGTRRLPSL